MPTLVNNASEVRPGLSRGREVASPQGVSPEHRGIESSRDAYRFVMSATL
jgi:hypothetical protein